MPRPEHSLMRCPYRREILKPFNQTSHASACKNSIRSITLLEEADPYIIEQWPTVGYQPSVSRLSAVSAEPGITSALTTALHHVERIAQLGPDRPGFASARPRKRWCITGVHNVRQRWRRYNQAVRSTRQTAAAVLAQMAAARRTIANHFM